MTSAGTFLTNTTITDAFWARLRETVRTQGLPYQWDALNDRIPDAEPSYCMRNFHAAAGKCKEKHAGFVFQDSDAAKWLEGVAYSLMWHPDAELEAIADGAIDDIVAAQQPDGYLDTYYILTGLEKRWTNLMDHHELYCAGHMLEAAVAYYEATGKCKLLDAMLRLMDHIAEIFGSEEGKRPGYPGHPVIEMALMRLYETTKEEKHLKLAEYFVRQRGQAPQYFEQEMQQNGNRCYWEKGPLQMAYYQAHKPLTEQEDAVGHSVRALYLYSGLADVARVTGAQDLTEACLRLWNSVTRKRMYITGAVGSSQYGEAFTFDYDLPNDTVYGETCAAIALVFFAQRMLRLQARGEYADVMERALYNGVISGMQLDGMKFFYVNPLEVVPEACEKDGHKTHVRPERQKWFGCACCPPNLIRLMTSLHRYACSAEGNTLFAHLYLSGSAEAEVNGRTVKLETATRYPWDGDVCMKLNTEGEMTLALRIPGWCSGFSIAVNGEDAPFELRDGYAYLTRCWHEADEVQLHLPMPVKLYRANPLVREDAGQLAVMRGPIVYCLEEADNGRNLHLLRLGNTRGDDFAVCYEENTLGGVNVLVSPGLRETESWAAEGLYAEEELSAQPVTLRWIPYYAWANRGVGEMRVWVRK